ncbi:DUF3907 family protein [Gottfriedia acidiceleris]|uniref:YpuI family protein n=1 Tax=Gottfriedia acidiceleris TaxID=371036 RepID=A0ABY4JS40_9BACI|nr:DUF3907 family protein [Gottfriedia acidiceleris]UPM55915.1 YpuI family protein [Gottfriedia acidiceleris]
MSNKMVEHQLKIVGNQLGIVGLECNLFLNKNSLPSFQHENQAVDLNYLEKILSSLRRITVYCEDAKEVCEKILSGQFHKATAEDTLHKIYHRCIAEFFSPKNDAWYENSRAAYTGNQAITFYKAVPGTVQDIFSSLEKVFQHMREELEYYETDYSTKLMQQYKQ